MKVSGTVFRSGTKERVANAMVKASAKGETTQQALTNDDGVFSFTNLNPAEWTFTAMHEEYFPSKPQSKPITDNTKLDLYLNRLAGENDQLVGGCFFFLLLTLLGAWLVLYIALHSFLPVTQAPISAVLGDQVAAAVEQMASLDKVSEDQALLAAVAGINADLEKVLAATTVLNRADKDLLKQAGAKAAEAVAANDKSSARARLEFLQSELTAPATRGFAIWDRDPWRLLEILLCGLAGVLINKIIVSSWYLYKQSFYASGLFMHIAHLAATPLLVLVAVLLLSLASVKISVAGSDMTLDLSNPTAMVVAAFILGTVSWPLWNFIEKTGRRIMGQQEPTPGSKSSAGGS